MSVMTHSYGLSHEAGGPAQVAGAGVSDVVVTTDGLLRRHGDRARCRAAHDTVSAVCLVSHTSVCPRTLHFGAGLLALSLVHDLQIGVSHAASHEQNTLVFIGAAIAAAHSVFQGQVGAVRGAHTLRPAHLHFTNLPRATLDSLAVLFTWLTGDNAQEAEEADFVHGEAAVGPGCV